MNVLWISPNLNDYKARFLEYLGEGTGPEITVMAGAKNTKKGHRYEESGHKFQRVDVNVSKSWFGFHPMVYWRCFSLLRNKSFDVVLMPVEKKHIFLICFLAGSVR